MYRKGLTCPCLPGNIHSLASAVGTFSKAFLGPQDKFPETNDTFPGPHEIFSWTFWTNRE